MEKTHFPTKKSVWIDACSTHLIGIHIGIGYPRQRLQFVDSQTCIQATSVESRYFEYESLWNYRWVLWHTLLMRFISCIEGYWIQMENNQITYPPIVWTSINQTQFLSLSLSEGCSQSQLSIATLGKRTAVRMKWKAHFLIEFDSNFMFFFMFKYSIRV